MQNKSVKNEGSASIVYLELVQADDGKVGSLQSVGPRVQNNKRILDGDSSIWPSASARVPRKAKISNA